MTDYKYKITIQEEVGDISSTRTVETSDISLVRELINLPIKEIKVITPNESIDPDWQSILEKLSKQLEKTNKQNEDKGSIIPMEAPGSPLPPMTPYVAPDWWKEIQENQRKFNPPFTVTY